MSYEMTTKLKPAGDQPHAIKKLVDNFSSTDHQVLLGVTGSGKTFTMAHVIANLNIPALVIAPNKTLAAQLYCEFKNFFSNNSVGYFVSYYDYYQPEAYIPSSDTYISKDSSINDDIDKMRHQSTKMMFESKNMIIVASVSCIYGLGSPQTYAEQVMNLHKGQKIQYQTLLRNLLAINYQRDDYQTKRGSFRVRGDIIDIFPSHSNNELIRLEIFCDQIETIQLVDVDTSHSKKDLETISLYPNSHYVTQEKNIKKIIYQIKTDLKQQTDIFKSQGKLIEAERLEQRTLEDIELFNQVGYCSGIENYSRYLTGSLAGEPPPCLLDYFPEKFLTIIDESHITVPQISGMYKGDRARKENLVKFGFRLPAALDNRPLNFFEFCDRTYKTLYVSATPSSFEKKISNYNIVEQIIRPTGLIDPPIEIRTTHNQVDDLFFQIKETIKQHGRILITTLTKKMSEDLSSYYQELGLKVKYLHSGIDTLERTHILRALRQGKFDTLIGINLLREGLDLPEVKLVAIMDADKEGFLRSKTSLIQTIGRAARNHESKVILYADTATKSITEALSETKRRRIIQQEYNKIHKITPKTICKTIDKDLKTLHGFLEEKDTPLPNPEYLEKKGISSIQECEKAIKKMTLQMKRTAKNLDFEKAAKLRDEIKTLKVYLIVYGGQEK